MFNDQDITQLCVSERCWLSIPRSFQIPHPFTRIIAFENVPVGETFGSRDSTIAPVEMAAAVLQLTGLKPKANAMAGSLTLLDRKRLKLARASSTDPELLLLNEIAGG